MKKLGVIGGMGTAATIDFFTKVMLITDAKSDKENLHIVVDNNSQVPDRTAYIFDNSKHSPLPQLIKTAKDLEKIGCDFLAMPCNTAHYFYSDIIKNIKIPIINMIDETAKVVINNNEKVVGLLSTKGTIKAKIYESVLSKYNIDVITPNEYEQDIIMQLIYDIKAGKTDFNKQEVISIIENMKKNGAKTIILGCTETPIGMKMLNIKENFLDPTHILATKCVEFAKMA